MIHAMGRRLAGFLTLGSVGDVVTQQRPPQQSDFGGGGLRSPIFINGLTGQSYIYVNGVILPFASQNGQAFGFRGTGTANDTSLLNAGIAALSAAGGGDLVFGPGTFVVNGSINYADNVNIFGAGRGVTTFKLASASSLNGSRGIFQPIGYGTTLPPRGYYSKNNTLGHFSIDGNVAGNSGHFYEGIAGGQCKDLLVQDVEAFGCGEVGLQGQVTNVGTDQNAIISFVNCIAHDNTSDGFQVGGASLVNCWAYNNGGSGIDSVGNFVSGNVDNVVTTIANCRADFNAKGGITSVLQAGPHIRTVISNCSAHYNTGNGIAANMKYTSISNCDVAFNTNDGIDCGADFCSIIGGKSMNNGTSAVGGANFRAGIKLTGTRNYCDISAVTLTDDQSGKTQQYALAFTAPGSGANNRISGCICSGNVNAIPYQITSATDWRVEGNSGISLTWTPVVTSQGGTLGATSATGTYWDFSGYRNYEAHITLTTVNTGTGVVKFTLPSTPSDNGTGYGVEFAVNGKQVSISITSGNPGCNISNSDASSPIVANAQFQVSGRYLI